MQNNERKPLGYLNLEEAVISTGYTQRYIRELAREKIIMSIRENGIKYYSEKDLKSRRQVPEGYMSLEKGVEEYRYSKSHFRKLVKRAKVPTIQVLRVVYFSVTDFERFLQIPDGYNILDRAAEDSIFARDTIRKLLNKGKVEGIKKFNLWYVSISNLRQYEAAYEEKKSSKEPNTTSIDNVVNSVEENL
jgi:hypothetical protein|tara:strand:- start:171 stop:740 length:570 start_codon:yes stop_codon:yes gene_type:complete